MEACSECRSVDLYEDYVNGCVVCTNCGLHASSYLISEQPEWRDNEQSRVGCSDDIGLSTAINHQSLMSQLHVKTTMSYGTRKALAAREKMRRYCAALNLGEDVAQMSGDLYKTFCDLGKVRNKDITILACIYLISVNQKVPRTFMEIESIASTLNMDITALNIQSQALIIIEKLDLTMEDVTPRQLVPRYCSYLKLTGLEPNAMHIADSFQKSPYSSHISAAIVIKIACDNAKVEMSYETLALVALTTPRLLKLAHLRATT